MPSSLWFILVGACGILCVTCLYPLFLLLRTIGHTRTHGADPVHWPSVTVITAIHNGGDRLAAKIANFRELDYPADLLSLIVASDASTDRSYEQVLAANDTRIGWVEQSERKGKAAALNLAASKASADLLLFSDVDAILTPSAVKLLARHFYDPRVGGVCGQRVPESSHTSLQDAQKTYIELDSRIKRAESVLGRLTSNDGKIHMIRADLFSPIPSDVTDDLYTALSLIARGFDVLFEPQAIATVRIPSRDATQEVQRRRRIVTRSLTGISRKRCLLNPFRFGWFAVGLLINKVGRRLLPFFLVSLIAGIYLLAASYMSHTRLAVTLISLVAAAILLYGVAARNQISPLLKLYGMAHYAGAGFIGSAWGVIDFLVGRRVHTWETTAPRSRNADA